MEEIGRLTQEMKEKTPASAEAFPDIDLYMDQVLSYLSRQQISFREDEKLTGAMINNYIKDGLLPRANGKKYSREHLAYLTIISRLKQVLSVKDTGTLLAAEIKEKGAEQYFGDFSRMLCQSLDRLAEEMTGLGDERAAQAAMKLAIDSYVSKIACEYLIDKLRQK